MPGQSYKGLVIYQLAHELAVKVHQMTITKLPDFEKYEEGAQIRRSSKSIVSNIVEGFGVRHHKKEFLRYLTIAYASIDETKEHLQLLYDTKSLKDKNMFESLSSSYQDLGRKVYAFTASVQKQHLTRTDE